MEQENKIILFHTCICILIEIMWIPINFRIVYNKLSTNINHSLFFLGSDE